MRDVTSAYSASFFSLSASFSSTGFCVAEASALACFWCSSLEYQTEGGVRPWERELHTFNSRPTSAPHNPPSVALLIFSVSLR